MMATQRLARDVLRKANGLLPSLCHRYIGLVASIGPVQRSSFSTSGVNRLSNDVGDLVQKRQGLPLDPEWNEMAKKQLKGADPAERLTWRTPEVYIHVTRFRPCKFINT